MKSNLSKEEIAILVEQIIDYLLKEGATRDFVNDEQMQVPANFVVIEYPNNEIKDLWNPAVFYSENERSKDGYDFSVATHNPILADKLNNLSYDDFLLLRRALVATGLFTPKKYAIHNETENSLYFSITHGCRIFTTFGQLKKYYEKSNKTVFDKSKFDEKRNLNDEAIKDLIQPIIDYLLQEGTERNFSDEEIMQVPANFVMCKYPNNHQKDFWNPAVFFSENQRSNDGYDFSVIRHDPYLAQELNKLSYHDFLALEYFLRKTKMFHPKPYTVEHDAADPLNYSISYGCRILTTFGKLKNNGLEKPRSL